MGWYHIVWRSDVVILPLQSDLIEDCVPREIAIELNDNLTRLGVQERTNTNQSQWIDERQ